ncbi:MAG: MFS transporter [Actinomycetota bacterium]|nr:MFS transporter [Actinomycetota bacterium]
MSSAIAPLRHPHFRWLWAGTVFSAAGTFIQTVAASWLMFEMTGSSTWVGLIVASSTLPILFLALAAGALADMFDRVKIMLVSQGIMGGSAVAMAVLAFYDSINPPLLLALGLTMGTGLALNIPAWQALVPDLVPRGLVASAVALQSAAFNAARAIGPAIGGALVVAFGPEAGFAVNALSYLAIIVALLAIGPQLELKERDAPKSMASAITTGIRFARFTPTFSRLLALVGLFAATSAVVQATLPVHTAHLGGSAATYGILLGAMGAGALVGAFVRAPVLSLIPGSSVPVTITLFGVAGITLGLAPNIIVAFISMSFIGFFWLLTLSTLNASAQLMAPNWIRGRAMSLYSLSFVGILPVGSIISGLVADQIGTPGSIVIFSVAALTLGLASPRFKVPAIHDIESPEFSESGRAHSDLEDLEGGPVIVLNTWRIDLADFNEFSELMNELRLVRLSTGAYRWRLFMNTSDPTRITELMAVGSWEEHLAQHRRIDDAAAGLIQKARSFDREGGPRTRHLIAIDVENPPEFDEMVVRHEEMHRTDGSIPVRDQDA